MSYLYKRSNRFWYYLIRQRLTGVVWRPLVEWTRVRHVRFRQRLGERPVTDEQEALSARMAPSVVSAGV
jgi:hypothetical protein